MFNDEYKARMEQIKPDVASVERILAKSKTMKKRSTVASVARVAALALCGILVLGGGVVAADAATDGAISRALGFGDSIIVAEDGNHIEELEDGTVELVGEVNGSTAGAELRLDITNEDRPVLFLAFTLKETKQGLDIASIAQPMETFEKCGKSYMEQAYEATKRFITNITEKRPEYAYGQSGAAILVERLEEQVKLVDGDTDLLKGCALGIQQAVDEFKAGK